MTVADAITQVTNILTSVTTIITQSEVLMPMFVAGLFVVGAKVFKRIKNAVK